MAATVTAEVSPVVDLDHPEIDDAVAPGRLAERHAIEQILDRHERSSPPRPGVLDEQEPPNLLQVLTGPLVGRGRHHQGHQQRDGHPGDGTP